MDDNIGVSCLLQSYKIKEKIYFHTRKYYRIMLYFVPDMVYIYINVFMCVFKHCLFYF